MKGEQRTLDGGMLVEVEGRIHKGRAGALAAVIGLMVAVVAGLFVLVGGDDEQRVFRELGKRINGTKQTTFDAYFSCLMDRQDPQTFRSNTELSDELLVLAFEIGPPWVKRAQEVCLPLLAGAEEQLSVLIAPKEISGGIKVMIESLAELRDASTDFFRYLAESEGGYDEEVLRQRATVMARPWYRFRKAHGEVNLTIKRKLESDSEPAHLPAL